MMDYALRLGPGDPLRRQGYVQISVKECETCKALVVEDSLAAHQESHLGAEWTAAEADAEWLVARLQEIADVDFRGNRSPESSMAKRALDEYVARRGARG